MRSGQFISTRASAFRSRMSSDINSVKLKLLSSSANLFSVLDSSRSIAVSSVYLFISSKLLSRVSVSSAFPAFLFFNANSVSAFIIAKGVRS